MLAAALATAAGAGDIGFAEVLDDLGPSLDTGLDEAIAALLAVGLYQLWDTRIPDHAAVSQTVEATRILRRPRLAGVINACLRRFRREDLAAAPARSEASKKYTSPRSISLPTVSLTGRLPWAVR